ncbi:hypothetical protein H0H92_012884 [Tricholoma furcatifolium]|nr:hypothetical protein H0H92_012884 [Tricholoma furcatifolium]
MPFFRAVALLSCIMIVSARNLTSKRGMAFSDPNTPGDIDNANQTQSQISWQYDWGSSPPEYLAIDGIQYIPMQWGSAGIQGFAESVKTQGASTILAFNEPDNEAQANIDPTDAVQLWQQYLEPMKADGVRLGGPAVSAASTGLPWLEQFMQACSPCSIDFIPLHWYGDGVEGFYDYLWQVHGTYPNTSIWVTEFASTSTNMSDLLGDNGSLNALGQLYVGAKTVHTQIVTQAPTPTYSTVFGADNPTQGLVTTYAAYPNGAVRGWDALVGRQAGFAVFACVAAAVWTVL